MRFLPPQLTHRFRNTLNHPIQMSVHFLIGKPQEPNAQSCDRGLPDLVSSDRLIGVMTFTIQFNGKFQLRAVKIQHIVIDTVLPTKLTVFDLATPQTLPNKLFRFGRILPQDSALFLFSTAVKELTHVLTYKPIRDRRLRVLAFTPFDLT